MLLPIILHNFHHTSVCAEVCSVEPVIIRAKSNAKPVYFHTLGYETGQYANNMHCSWILMGSNNRKRIVLTVHDSSIDDAFFAFLITGDSSKSPELVRWCGNNHPDTIISTTDSLYVQFHSDEMFQERGFNMSFIEFGIPSCPPNWFSSSLGYCYILKKSIYGLTWSEAQKRCGLKRSNLLTFIIYAENKTIPWIGYLLDKEGRLTAVDSSSEPWPEDLSKLARNGGEQGCAYTDWNYERILNVDDCRNQHEFICKRRQDGNTVPYSPLEDVKVNDIANSPANFTIWLFLLLLLFLLLILLYLCYRKYKKQHGLSRISTSDANQRLVGGPDVSQTTITHVAPEFRNIHVQENNVSRNDEKAGNNINLESTEQNKREAALSACHEVEDHLSAISDAKQNIGGREITPVSTTREETLLRIRRSELFERPRVSVLDHTSAISLDEFWNKNEASLK
ncbi:unnamed protein product [Thelazia callipaeda]|uniref:CUB domain-containing protein n=1 Tax=Thelazia callipaeda TaxID=103827 RepID=A0A0N5D832_THECL|nr:unnamed protein product [Thelazia callipaeda]